MTDALPQALVIDDDEDMNAIVGAYVEMSGLGYRSAADGQTGLDEIARARPDVVLLDVMLPDLDGFEVLRQIRGHADTRGLPVIMLTALGDPASRQRGHDAGASDYVAKPFDPELLMQTLKRYAPATAAGQ